jgi:hypothetical protein
MKKLTTEEFIEKAKQKHGEYYDYSKVEYNGTHEKVCIICPKHGEFWQTPHNHLLRNGGCIQCQHENQTYTQNEIIDKFKQKHGGRYDYSKVEYKGISNKVCIICPKHGEFWQTPHEHIRGCGCPLCANNIKLTTEEFIKKAKQIHEEYYDYSKVEYNGSHNKVCIICPKHGEFWQTPCAHLLGCGCSLCYKISKIEKEVKKLLDILNIEYSYQKKFSWLGQQTLDFYLPDSNIAIECQGRQHFEPVRFGGISIEKSIDRFNKQTIRDKNKYILCKEHNVKLLYYSNVKKKLTYDVFSDLNKLKEEIIKYYE